MRAAILSIACVAGLSLSASQASAGTFSFGWYSPSPVVVVSPVPTYYYPPVVTTYYPSYPSYVPVYVAPPVYTFGSYRTYPAPAYYPSSGFRSSIYYRR